MAARPISFAVEEADLPLLDELAAAFGSGNRSEFLRVAIAEFKERLRLQRLHEVREQMESLHDEALAERGGRVFTSAETLALIENLEGS
ncbi:hypothetical protein FHX49_000643 [Microbacterium endophyticum]|uniref:Ribbon-helix-helix protein CopG domain-containing protein n=1 Tax=Microbacterium endophyticum TaxID=1526412 RepID=A0A7W4V1I1_9MICO|nr:ribbon-helix-helix protein, CopG family [Microbacterium endophyticum]MBB2975102.1 hypothetical protein [Microbacterium endophyticum]NIK37358.1 hypothetical protein [Microbacterium endophyticum]